VRPILPLNGGSGGGSTLPRAVCARALIDETAGSRIAMDSTQANIAKHCWLLLVAFITIPFPFVA
jgi:hypothetical protein